MKIGFSLNACWKNRCCYCCWSWNSPRHRFGCSDVSWSCLIPCCRSRLNPNPWNPRRPNRKSNLCRWSRSQRRRNRCGRNLSPSRRWTNRSQCCPSPWYPNRSCCPSHKSNLSRLSRSPCSPNRCCLSCRSSQSLCCRNRCRIPSSCCQSRLNPSRCCPSLRLNRSRRSSPFPNQNPCYPNRTWNRNPRSNPSHRSSQWSRSRLIPSQRWSPNHLTCRRKSEKTRVPKRKLWPRPGVKGHARAGAS